MKKIAIILFIASVIIFSCTKSTSLINKDDLAGTWLLKKYAGGYSYQEIIPTDTITATFDQSGKFSSSANFNIPPNGNYTITNDTEGYHYSDTIINLSAEGFNQITFGFNLKKDTLILSDGCCDRFAYTYVRLKEHSL